MVVKHTRFSEPQIPAHKHTQFEHRLLKSNRQEKELLLKCWKATMPRSSDAIFSQDVPSAKRNEYFLNFRNDASAQGIADAKIFGIFDRMKAVYDVNHWKDVTGGQRPGLMAIASTSNSLVGEIFCGNRVKIKDKIASENVFVTSTRMYKREHVDKEASDFTPPAYLLNHLRPLEKNCKDFSIMNDMAPYIIFMGDYDRHNHINNNFDQVSDIQIYRMEKLLRKLEDMNYVPKPTKYGETKIWGYRGNDFYLVPIVHDVEKRQLWAVWRNGDKIEKMRFEDFVKKEGLESNRIVSMHLRNIAEYGKDENATKINMLRRCCKTAGCVDSRHQNKNSSGLLKLIGGIPSDADLRRLLENKEIETVTFSLHTSCGYINSSIAVHDMLLELKKADKTSHDLVQDCYSDLNSIVRGKKVFRKDAPEMAQKLGLSDIGQAIFVKLFMGDPKDEEIDARVKAGKTEGLVESNFTFDLQRTVKHIWDRGVIIEEVKGSEVAGFYMPAVRNVEDFIKDHSEDLKAHNVFIDAETISYLVTEEVGRQLWSKINRMKREIGAKTETGVVISSIKNGGNYLIPPKLKLECILDMKRKMFYGVDELGEDVFIDMHPGRAAKS